MRKELFELVDKGGGVVTSAEATAMGIARRELSEAVERGELSRIARGVYALPDAWEDEFALAQHRFSRGVFSHETALYLHGLTDRAPAALTMTFPHGYNTGSARAAGIDARTVTAGLVDLGATVASTPYGNEVRAYCPERALCDLFRSNPAPDLQLALPAIRAYLASEARNTVRLMGYARRMRVEARLRPYVEAIL
ncbi:MAG: type IV toxin-antitoxin system AbiEi family antitoxin domain-containing protein [Coriobacteriales bacterium]|nr:type IV toxin-antitoxin system AbiEi family antitoxin domain-containing protein [Coriobacteriales bacterium]